MTDTQTWLEFFGELDTPLTVPQIDDKAMGTVPGTKPGIEPASSKASIRFRLKYKIYTFTNKTAPNVHATYFLAALEGTTVNPGKQFQLKLLENMLKGWYTERVDIEMSFLDLPTVPPQSPVNGIPITYGNDVGRSPQGMLLATDSPPTSPFNASSQSSISRTLGLGFFGTSATGSASLTISNSFAFSLHGIGLENDSDGTSAIHHYVLQSTRAGPYSGPQSLKTSNASALSSTGTHSGLAMLPPNGVDAFQIPSQGLWLANAEQNSGFMKDPLKATLPFQVTIRHGLRWMQIGAGALPEIAPTNVGEYTELKTIARQWVIPINIGA